jgi:hypothetical protein
MGLTEREGLILQALNADDIEKVRSLHSKSLTKQKERIVGVRVEDLLYLLESVHAGHMPVKEGTRFKEEGYFYLVPNPESLLLQKERQDLIYNPDIQNADSALRTFPEALDEAFRYTESAAIAAIHRNLVPLVQDWEPLVKSVNKFYGESDLGKDIIQERLLEGLIKTAQTSIENGRPITSFTPNNRYLFDLFDEALGHSIPRDVLGQQLVDFSQRSSVVVAFNETLLHNRTATNKLGIVHSGNEFAVRVSGGELPLDCIAGFESLGEFEDRVLNELGIAA